MDRETEVLKTLLSLGQLISSHSQLRIVIKRICSELRRVLSADECSLFLLDEENRELAFMESTGLTRWERDHIRFKLGEGVAGWVAKHKKPVLIPDVALDKRFVSIPKQRRRIVSMISVPLVVNRRVLGVLTLTTREPHQRFRDADLQLAVLLSAHISLAIENNRLYEISVLDGLTNLYNRRYMMQRLGQELSYSKRLSHPLTVCMADVDYFKRVNDTYGHQVGDQVLRSVAQVLTRSLRPYDVIGRYGGEEFTVIFPSVDKHQAANVAERLRTILAETPVRARDKTLHVTASFGLAAFPEDAEDGDTLLHAADRALYDAKAKGRNMVVLA